MSQQCQRLRRLIAEPANQTPWTDETLAGYLDRRDGDLWAAAADVWEEKAAGVAAAYDFSADGHSLSRSQLPTQYLRQATMCRSRARIQGVHRDELGDANE